jgi:hypothetical protein
MSDTRDFEIVTPCETCGGLGRIFPPEPEPPSEDAMREWEAQRHAGGVLCPTCRGSRTTEKLDNFPPCTTCGDTGLVYDFPYPLTDDLSQVREWLATKRPCPHCAQGAARAATGFDLITCKTCDDTGMVHDFPYPGTKDWQRFKEWLATERPCPDCAKGVAHRSTP